MAGAQPILYWFVDLAVQADETMIVKIPAELIVTESAREQQPRRLDRSGGDDDDVGAHCVQHGFAGAVGHHIDRGTTRPITNDDRLGVEDKICVAGGQSTREEGVVSTILGVHRTGVPDA
jgi:hypothetical protein